MHDKTLMDLVEKKPTTFDELEDVHGMGPLKIKKYGKEILKVLGSGL